jgi:Lon protease-like protein
VSDETENGALFPLHTVLFPGGPLALRIFEPRYVDMVSECLRGDLPFGVCLIQSGNEAGNAAEPHPVGTFARITDWRQGDDGLLGLTALGEQRFRILESHVEPNQLLRGRLQSIADEESVALPERCAYMTSLLEQLLARADDLYPTESRRYEDASWVGFRLAEILSMPLTRKQYLLELSDPLLRLDQLHEVLLAMSEGSSD